MNVKPKFYMMVGISGSGKSTYANKIKEQEEANGNVCEIISSDKMRFKLFGDENDQTHNEEVFKRVYELITYYLCNNISVIFDATSITIKSRKKAFDMLRNIECEKIAVIMTTSIKVCIDRDAKRDRVVGSHVITRQLSNFNIPFYGEGFDKIIFSEKIDITLPEDYYNTYIRFEQHNPHHNFTLGKHCEKTRDYVRKNVDEKYKKAVDVASYFHDIGKLFVYVEKEGGVWTFHHHAEYGAYTMLNHMGEIASYSDIELNDKADDFILDVIFYINYHMYPFDWKEEKTKIKYKQLFGEEKYNNLLILHEADKNSSK